MYGIKIQGLAGSVARHTGGALGEWVKSYNPNAFGGRGDVETTANPALALAFNTRDEALTFYRQMSKAQPTRADGLPNRPLTAFTVSIEVLPARARQ